MNWFNGRKSEEYLERKRIMALRDATMPRYDVEVVGMTENGVKLVKPGVKRGRMLVKGELPANLPRFNSETARLAVQKRISMAKERAAQGMMEAVNEMALELIATGKSARLHDSPADAYGAVIKHATAVYMKSEKITGMSDLGTFIARASGMMKEVGEKEAPESPMPMLGLEDAKTIQMIFNVYEQRYPEGSVIDV